MTTDITNVQMAYMFTIRLLARAPIMIILFTDHDSDNQCNDCRYYADYRCPFWEVALIFIAKKAHPHFVQVFDEYDVLNNTVQENVNAARVVKAYVRADHEVEKFGKVSTHRIQAVYKSRENCGMELTGYAVYGICGSYYYGY